MSSHFFNNPELSQQDMQRLLDRLVDGELNEAERRELLLQLDSQADGWRHCALAFLEAQAWEGEFRALSELPARPATMQPAGQGASPASGSWLRGRWGTLLAVATSFFMAFGLGTAWRSGESLPVGADDIGQVAQQPSPPKPSASVAARDAMRSSREPQQLVPRAEQLSLQPEWGTVTVSVDRNRDGVSESLDVPVASGVGIDEAWLQSQPPALPPGVRRVLERMGHRVRHERQYIPFDLNDGRRVVVPVDEVNVQFVGDRQYQ